MKYETWRDSRTAIFIFNKSVKISTIINNLDSAVRKHPCFIKEYKYRLPMLRTQEGVFGYVFHHKDNPEIHYNLSVLIFNIPQRN